jgi:hypothetical protein
MILLNLSGKPGKGAMWVACPACAGTGRGKS